MNAKGSPRTRSAPPSLRSVVSSRWSMFAILAATAVFGAFPTDVQEYRYYAQEFLTHFGRLWPFEYPPASIIPMMPAALSPFAFGFAMAGIGLAVYETLRRVAPQAASWWLVLTLAGAMFTTGGRYDIVPAACCLWGVLAAERRNWRAAWFWSAVAACLQWFGAVLWPLWLIAEWRETGRWRLDRASWQGLRSWPPTE